MSIINFIFIFVEISYKDNGDVSELMVFVTADLKEINC